MMYDPLLIVVFVVGYWGWSLYLIARMNFPWGTHDQRDLNHLPPLEGANQDHVRRLADLGFRPFGIVEVRLFWQPKAPLNEWLYIDASGTVMAQVNPNVSPDETMMLLLTTWFPDDALLETYFPKGESITTVDYNARYAEHDLDLAYRSHCERRDAWITEHGHPVVIRSVRQWLDYDAIDNQKHRRRRYGRTTRTQLLILLAVTLGSLLPTAIDAISGGAYSPEVEAGLMLGVIFCLVIGLYVLYRFNRPGAALDAPGRR